MIRLVAAVTLSVILLPAPVWAQGPPNQWHPYRGGTNCIQVADSQGNFNCAAGTKVDPTTGNMIVGGTLAFTGLLPGTFVNGLALASLGTQVQLLGPGDLVVATSPPTILGSGPLMKGAVLRVRALGPGLCQWVTAGGNNVQEYVIPTLNALGQVQATFPGGPSGC